MATSIGEKLTRPDALSGRLKKGVPEREAAK
jgi:hypothetical protein